MVVAKVATPKRSRVVYYPSEEDGRPFAQTTSPAPNTSGKLPPKFPKQLSSSLVWKGNDIEARSDEWSIDLSATEVNSIKEALRHFDALECGASDIREETFPLPTPFVQRLRQVSQRCYSGPGFCVIRGINPDDFTLLENVLIFAGLSTYIAPGRGYQDKERKEAICHIVSRAQLQDAAKEQETPAFTEGALSFHTDLGEILALSTLEIDQQGQMMLASTWQIYNELATSRPDIINTLSQDWVWDTFMDYAKVPPFKMPLMTWHNNKLITHLSRYPLTGFGSFQRNPELPPITPEQIDALDAVHFIAQRNAMRLPNRKGDIVYINNMALLHARDALKGRRSAGGAQGLSGRHRLKLFLRDPELSWGIPYAYRRVWNELYGPNTEDGRHEEHWMLEPERKPVTKWRTNG